jgi:hypothetical protein
LIGLVFTSVKSILPLKAVHRNTREYHLVGEKFQGAVALGIYDVFISAAVDRHAQRPWPVSDMKQDTIKPRGGWHGG